MEKDINIRVPIEVSYKLDELSEQMRREFFDLMNKIFSENQKVPAEVISILSCQLIGGILVHTLVSVVVEFATAAYPEKDTVDETVAALLAELTNSLHSEFFINLITTAARAILVKNEIKKHTMN